MTDAATLHDPKAVRTEFHKVVNMTPAPFTSMLPPSKYLRNQGLILKVSTLCRLLFRDCLVFNVRGCKTNSRAVLNPRARTNTALV